MSFKVTGLDKFQKQLKQLEKNAKELEKTKTVSFDVLFNSRFMRKYTSFASFDELLESGGFTVNSQEDFEAIPDNEMDELVCKTTKFASWDDMLSKATEIYAMDKLGL